jgi:phosphoribosylaminoimidazolecarboxamide formyltransferase/IMP cyclohydrolase
MPRALLSVYDKTDLEKFAAALLELGWSLVASGGTEKTLRAAGIEVVGVDEVTGVPEILGGRVKTLHPAIHAGILARDRQEDIRDLQQHGFAPFNLVAVNLYPFQETVAKVGVTLQDAVEQIDIGGMALLRAAAKNFFHVAAICDPSDYMKVIAALRAGGDIDLALRRNLAVKAFAHARDYDTAIHAFLSRGTASGLAAVSDDLPEQLSLGVQKVETLRYGENPHQVAAYYSRHAGAGALGGTLLGGKSLSYTNILDVDAAWRAVSSFEDPAVAIIKHMTPCGVATGATIAEAFPRALASDPVSAFGCAMAVNREVDEGFVNALGTLLIDDLAAPSFASSALDVLRQKRKNCRLLQIPLPYDGSDLEVRTVHRGVLVQRIDMGDPEGTLLKTVTQRAPTPEEMQALHFAWKVVQHVKSNAIVLALPGATVGIGGGLTSRVDAARLAVEKAGDRAGGSVMASDAMIPFADGLLVVAEAGVTAVIQPGGSIRDSEVIDAANRHNIAMVFTNTRHFRH